MRLLEKHAHHARRLTDSLRICDLQSDFVQLSPFETTTSGAANRLDLAEPIPSTGQRNVDIVIHVLLSDRTRRRVAAALAGKNANHSVDVFPKMHGLPNWIAVLKQSLCSSCTEHRYIRSVVSIWRRDKPTVSQLDFFDVDVIGSYSENPGIG